MNHQYDPLGDYMEALARKPTYSDPDADLVSAAQRDPTRFLALYERYLTRVHRYVRMRVRHEETAEDITSQIFLTVLARVPSYRGEGCFGAWLFRIAHNTVQDSYRARPKEPAGMDMLEALPDHEPGPEARAVSGETFATLQYVISTLRPEQQHLLALRYGADQSAAEIGAVIGKSPEAVRVQLHRTIKELRQRYQDER
jgi:RNA polymerase sigma-70 factor, ECF subfamily